MLQTGQCSGEALNRTGSLFENESPQCLVCCPGERGEQTDLRGTVGWGRVGGERERDLPLGEKGCDCGRPCNCHILSMRNIKEERERKKRLSGPPPPPSLANQTLRLRGLDGGETCDWLNGRRRRCKSKCYTAARAEDSDAWEILLNSFSGKGHFLLMSGFVKPHWCVKTLDDSFSKPPSRHS